MSAIMSLQEETNISQKLDRVLYILENDDKTNRKGLVQDVNDLKLQVQELLTKERINESKTALLGAIGGAVFTIAFWILQYFIKIKK